MNARELLADARRGKADDEFFSQAGWDVVIAALELKAAAEANDGSTPETDRLFTVKNIGAATKDGIGNDDLYAAFVAIERERNGLAARVRELERGIEIATDRLTGPGGVLSAIDAARRTK